MKMKNAYMTVQEAVSFTNKSEKTIRRLVKSLVKEDKESGQTISQDTDKIKVDEKNGKAYYLLSRSFLVEKYRLYLFGHMTGQRTEHQSKKTASSKDLERYIAFLEGQIKVKDEQINNFQERDKEHNILIKGLQERVFLLEGGQHEDSHVIYQEPSQEEKREQEIGNTDSSESNSKPIRHPWWWLFGKKEV